MYPKCEPKSQPSLVTWDFFFDPVALITVSFIKLVENIQNLKMFLIKPVVFYSIYVVY